MLALSLAYLAHALVVSFSCTPSLKKLPTIGGDSHGDALVKVTAVMLTMNGIAVLEAVQKRENSDITPFAVGMWIV